MDSLSLNFIDRKAEMPAMIRKRYWKKTLKLSMISMPWRIVRGGWFDWNCRPIGRDGCRKHRDAAHAAFVLRCGKRLKQHERHPGDNQDQLRYEKNADRLSSFSRSPAWR